MCSHLFASNPFPQQPPRIVRAVIWQYWFSTREEKRTQGIWWTRQLLGLYAPTLAASGERKTDGARMAVGNGAARMKPAIAIAQLADENDRRLPNCDSASHASSAPGPTDFPRRSFWRRQDCDVDVFEAEAVRWRRCADAGAHDSRISSRLWFRGSSAGRGLAVFSQRCRSRSHGLEWIHSPSTLAHPLDDGTAVLLDRDFAQMKDDARARRQIRGAA